MIRTIKENEGLMYCSMERGFKCHNHKCQSIAVEILDVVEDDIFITKTMRCSACGQIFYAQWVFKHSYSYIDCSRPAPKEFLDGKNHY
jgi:hypothetical protein